MIEKNKDKTRMSMQMNLNPVLLNQIKKKHENQIKNGILKIILINRD